MKTNFRWIALLGVLVIALSFAFTYAQESTPEASEGGMITCDSDLILTLYIAERYFGFGAVRNQMMTSGADASTMVDLATLNTGQYAPLFDAMMGMMGESMMMPDTTMTEEQMTGMSDMMMMDDTAMMEQMQGMMPEGMDMSTMTMLAPSTMEGELAECSSLRAELRRFFTAIAYQDMAMGMGAGTDTGAAATEMMNFSTTLSGPAEVPGPGDEDGTGTAAVTIDMANSQLCYTIAVQNITLPAAAGHIHRGEAGVAGDVVVPFDVVPDASGNAASCVVVEPALLTEIADNPAGFYVNIHTSDFPGGAVRGQVAG